MFSTSLRRCNTSAGYRLSTPLLATSGCGAGCAIFERSALTGALEDRSVVQATLMRSTIHMVAADDFWTICAGIRASRREWWLRIAKSRHLPAISYEKLADSLRAVLADGPLPRVEVVAAMERAGFAKPFWECAGLWVDMVRVPPSGTWDRRRADRYGLADQWIVPADANKTEVVSEVASEVDGLRLLLTRYLQAFGPAAVVDAASWAGVPRARLEPVAGVHGAGRISRRTRHCAGRSSPHETARRRYTGPGAVPADLGRNVACPLPPLGHPPRSVPHGDLSHQDPAVGRNGVGRRLGGRDVGLARRPGRSRRAGQIDCACSDGRWPAKPTN